MKIPVGIKIKDLEITEPKATILLKEGKKSALTGYIRVSYEQKGINDFYLFFIDGIIKGIYGEEMLTEKEIFGDEARDLALTIFSRGIASIYELTEAQIHGVIREEPRILLEEKDIGFNEKLEAQLKRLNIKGDFLASLIADVQGLPVAAMDSSYNNETIAALSALVREVSYRAESQLGFKHMDEVSLVDDDKIRLVCRYFQVGDNPYILSCLVPANQTYRRLTNTAIREISKIMKKRFD
jgi:predicted regulator of Ras-like GTPase activity (Roadblock/LC7/MglB family)